MPTDGLAPNGARPSAGTIITIKLDMFSSSVMWVIWLYNETFA